MNPTPYIADDRGSEEGASKLPDWREGVAILMERIWLGVFVATAVFLFLVLNAYRQTPYYRSTATLLVEAQIPKILNYQDILAFNTRNLEYFNTHINALHSRQMMEQALTESGLLANPAFFSSIETPEGKVAATRKLVSIIPVEKSRMINISVEYPDPQVASDLANALAHSYIQQDLDNRMGASMEAIEWLRARSDEYRKKLEEGFLQLQEYREETGSVSLEEDQNIVIEKLKALNAALTLVQTERIQAETMWESVQAQIDDRVPMTKVASLLEDLSVQASLEKLQEQQREVARLQQRYKKRHPDLKQAIELEKKLQKQLEEVGTDSIHAMKSRFEMLVSREKSLQKVLKKQEQAAFDLDRKLVRYNQLKRSIEADEEIHQAVIARMNEASISESMPTDIIRLVEEARPAKVPFRPRMGQAVVRGIALGLILGVGVIFLFYYADHRFRRNEEVERLLGLPVLSTLPLMEEDSIRERGLITHLKHSSEVTEAFRTLRASLLLKEEMHKAPVLMITSAGSGEGKSLVSSNLAISLAQDGRRTLLVGADLRRPVLSQTFGFDKKVSGLVDILRGEICWREALLQHEIPNLDVLPSGRIASHSAELLGRKPFAEFLRDVRGIYDHIILDAPPILGASDSLVLLLNVDAVLFVIRYGITHSMGARHAIRKMQESKIPCLGCIMNGVNFRTLANAYYYRRYGGGGYRYSQTDSETPASSVEG